MRCVMVVEDCFTIDGKGLAVVGSQLVETPPRESSVVEIRRLGLRSLSSVVVDTGIFSSPMDDSRPRAFSILLPANLRVEDVPLGSELWQSAAMS